MWALTWLLMMERFLGLILMQTGFPPLPAWQLGNGQTIFWESCGEEGRGAGEDELDRLSAMLDKGLSAGYNMLGDKTGAAHHQLRLILDFRRASFSFPLPLFLFLFLFLWAK